MTSYRPEFKSVSEIANIYRVRPLTIYRLVESGSLQVSRVGRAIRIDLADAKKAFEVKPEAKHALV